MKHVVLVDCNNFFVSCERIFNPTLLGKPVVVLSSNDACVIARSNEAKALGIAMGVPAYECKYIFARHKVIVCSANFPLYGDISSRVMQTLTEFCTDIEVYSVDESFLVLPDYETQSTNFSDKDTFYTDYMRYIKTEVKKRTGIPVSIGKGPTKTLAKIANAVAKKNPQYNGVFDITNHPALDTILASMDVGDIWGVGYRYTKLLKSRGIRTIADFKNLDERWVRKHMTINGLKTLYELRGMPCIALQDSQPDKQSITVSRSFGQQVTTLSQLQEAVAQYITQAAEKLRNQRMIAHHITVFVTFTHYHATHRSYNAANIELPIATAYTPDLIQAAHRCLVSLFKKGLIYKKAGVIFTDLIPAQSQQMNLFSAMPDTTEQSELMNTIDIVNKKWGRDSIFYAAAGTTQPWKMKQLKKSACFTTNWNEILTITI